MGFKYDFKRGKLFNNKKMKENDTANIYQRTSAINGSYVLSEVKMNTSGDIDTLKN